MYMIDWRQYHFLYQALKLDFLVKSVVSIILGGIVGYERGIRKKPAGLRTHILVTIGACTYMQMAMIMPSLFSGRTDFDPSRVLGQIVVGISFIGAGTVIRTGDKVAGLTTAATIWVTAAIGITVATGYYIEAVYLTITTFLVLHSLGRLTN